ncbi:ABC transporter permease [uncultured Methylobacterium sp.]|uniref:ABC transporter permease n=1 Tax=uncultured Methylobacterium sp. TaxID=157278 RepID=UPI0035C9D7B9
MLLLLMGLYGFPLLAVAANRLAIGVPAHGAGAIGKTVHLVAGSGSTGLLLLIGRRRATAVAALVLIGSGLLFLLVGLGEGAEDLLAAGLGAMRASLASGAWITLVVLGTGTVWAIRDCRVGGLGIAVAIVLGVALLFAGRTGFFDHLSLAVEFQARRALVAEAVLQHLILAGGALALAILLAVAASLWRRGQGIVEIAVSGIQVVPAVALFGALVAMASALLKAVPAMREAGFSALGPGPALIGIAAYLLLPLWRGLAAGLGGTDAAILDAAKAMGLSRTQVLMRVRLPLGAPVLIGALRVAAVQSLGLATLGALVGAGGLGRIVFDGMAQFAPDLILLGALPIVALSLVAETALSALEAKARTWWSA